MFKSSEHGIAGQTQNSLRTAQADFTRSGWRQFARLNRRLGVRFIRGFVLRYELGVYLAAHEDAGAPLDEGCMEVRYEDGVYLLMKKMQGVWYITDVFCTEEAVAYEPVFCWKRIRRGASFILAHVLIGWQALTQRMVRVV